MHKMQQLKAWFLTRTSQIAILSTSYYSQTHKSLENSQDFFVKTKTKTFTSRPRPRLWISRPRPRLYFLSSRRLETKTLVSRTTSLVHRPYYIASNQSVRVYRGHKKIGSGGACSLARDWSTGKTAFFHTWVTMPCTTPLTVLINTKQYCPIRVHWCRSEEVLYPVQIIGDYISLQLIVISLLWLYESKAFSTFQLQRKKLLTYETWKVETPSTDAALAGVRLRAHRT